MLGKGRGKALGPWHALPFTLEMVCKGRGATIRHGIQILTEFMLYCTDVTCPLSCSRPARPRPGVLISVTTPGVTLSECGLYNPRVDSVSLASLFGSAEYL